YRTPELQTLDPDNKLLGRMTLHRLAAEDVRDALVAATGRLNRKLYGTPVPIRPDEAGQIVIGVDTNDAAGRPTGKFVPLDGEEYRRSLYVQVRRSRPLAMLETFDGATASPNCDCRVPSTVTPQSLLLMNSRDVIDLVDLFAQRLEREKGAEAQVKL